MSGRDAVRIAKGGRSLGLWETADGPDNRWRRTWVVVRIRFYRDITVLSLGGPIGSTPPPPRPGWAREVTMVDAVTGRILSGCSF
ncbi:hypothetical protein [Nocardioides ultimimeridianus]